MIKMAALVFLSLISAALAVPNLILTPRANVAAVAANSDYRLPSTTVPSRYEIHLAVPREALEGGITNYTGSVNIVFQVTEAKNTVLLHSLVNIISITATTSDTLPQVLETTHVVNAETEIVTIQFTNNLVASTDYNLLISFGSTLDTVSMQGFYRSEYTANGVTEYLGTTQFEPTHARRAFPCFDEPQYKATFALTLTYPIGFVAAANTLGTTTTSAETITNVFAASPRMSTYTLAFTVSKFDCTASTPATVTSITHRVCSRPDLVAQRALAVEYGVKVLDAMDLWTNLAYSTLGIAKMDQFAIPDFSAGAMENWGLVTYREYLLLYSDVDTSNKYKQQVISIIAHEFAHMWFGNLVTTEWWDTLFLNEAFANYFQYFILNEITELVPYEMGKQFILESQQLAFSQDASLSSPSLTSEAFTPTQIWNKFNTISYQKGGSVLRMVENIIGAAAFKTGLNLYLTQNAHGTATPAILWNALSTAVPTGALPTGLTFLQFVENWTYQPGFPVVRATVNGNNVILSQERFLYSGAADTKWHVPITYVSSNDTVLQTIWLEANNQNVTLENVAENNRWVIINQNSVGYYRVHYDNTLRQRIIAALRSNHEQISDLSRSQIIDDALNLAQADQIKYSEAFELLHYLKNETSYYPWYSTLSNMNYVFSRLGRDSVVGQRVDEFLLDLIENVSANVSTTNWETADHLTTLKLPLVWSAACQSGQESCITETRRLFQAFRVNNTSINSNIRSVVYCNALRHSVDIETDYTFLWNRLQSVNQPHETVYILLGLGCTTSRPHLIRYLQESVNPNSVIRVQDFATIWSSVYSSGSVGVDVSFEYFRDNHENITSYYPDAVSMLSAIASRFTTATQISQLEDFFNQLEVNSTISIVAESALVSAKQNLERQAIIKSDLEQYFGIRTDSSAGTFGVSFLTLLVSVFVIKYIC